MRVRSRAVALCIAVASGFVGFLACPENARAAGVDEQVSSSVERILAGDFANANYGDAKRKLKQLVDRCKKGCQPSTNAAAHLALGMVDAQIGQKEEAKTEFVSALEADPGASLPKTGVTDAITAAWAEGQKAWAEAHPQPDDATKAGWTSKAAFDLAKAAVAADQAGDTAGCIEKDRAALSIEEQPRARLHLSGCESKASKVIDGLRDAQKALSTAASQKDDAVAKAAQKRIEELLPRVAHVDFEVPAGVSEVHVSWDEKVVPKEKLTQKFSIDPGHHNAHAEGTVSGAMLAFDQGYDVADGQSLTVKITLKPVALTQGQLSCMLSAKTQEEILKCLPQERKPLVVSAGTDLGLYSDTTHVNVTTPSIHAAIVSPTQGWNVAASYLVDFVSAASPDIVSSASSHFTDTRHAVTAAGGYKPGRWGAQAHGFFSTEHDYTSRGAGLSLEGDFMEKQITPVLAFSHSQDTIGRTGTPFDVFSHSLATNEFQAGATMVMTRTSILVLGATMQIESGDQSKPYRYIPMFANGVTVPIGASVSQVNDARLGVKPLEQLPLDRDRYALSARYALRRNTSTIRLEERVYIDSWGVKASTSDGRWIFDMGKKLRIWPHAHLHVQTGASFYQRVYNATLATDGSTVLPQVRTDDRELSPLTSLTLGGGARYAFSAPEAKIQYGVSLQADAMGTKYFNALFLKYRLAEYGTVGFDVEFE